MCVCVYIYIYIIENTEYFLYYSNNRKSAVLDF